MEFDIDFDSGTCFNSRLVRLEGKQPLNLVIHKKRFNSRLVRLEVPYREPLGTDQWRFNSRLVRLEVGNIVVRGWRFRFNSRLVRLEGRVASVNELTILRFNSRLVRLEVHVLSPIFPQITHLFQFQTGSIRRFGSRQRYGGYSTFQFQTGSIRRENL